MKIFTQMEFPEKLLKLRKRMGFTQEEMGKRLGISGNYISVLESGGKVPSDAVRNHVDLLEMAVDSGLFRGDFTGLSADAESEVEMAAMQNGSKIRMIPVISSAHAGEATCYEELPKDWCEWLPSDCPDPLAFYVRLKGISMKDEYLEHDLLTLMPSYQIVNDCLAVIRKTDGGIQFRRVEIKKETLRVVPINLREYEPEEIPKQDVTWAYPVYGMWRPIWK